MNYCFGIISYNNENVIRQEKFNNLLKKINELFPNIDILLIAQGYKEELNYNNLISFNFNKPLGILNARKELRKQFLNLNYDYIIMLDDDIEFLEDIKDKWGSFEKTLSNNLTGFFFRKIKNVYLNAELNFCAISRYILELEDFINVDPQKNEAYEDCLYSSYLHYKYPNNEIDFNYLFIKMINYTPSTWCIKRGIDRHKTSENTRKLINIIKKTKTLPDLDVFFGRIKYDIPFKTNYSNELKIVGKESKEEILILLKNNFVVDEKPKIGGYYLLDDGLFIKSKDHGDFDRFLIKKGYYINSSKSYSMGDGSQFLEQLGAIRLRSRSFSDKEFGYMPPFIIIRNKINSIQYDKLLEWLNFVRSTNNRLMLFINGKEKRYNDYIIDDVIKDIKKYFEKGMLV